MASRTVFAIAIIALAACASAQLFDEALYETFDEPHKEDILNEYDNVKQLPEDEEFLQVQHSGSGSGGFHHHHHSSGSGRGKFAFRFPPAAPHQGHTDPYPKGTTGSAGPYEANAAKFDHESKHEHRAAVTKAMEDAALKGAQKVFRKAEANRKDNSQSASVSKAANVAAAAARKFKNSTDNEKKQKAAVKRAQKRLRAARAAAKIALQRKLAADAIVRKRAAAVAKAQQKEFSAKLKAESRGMDYKKKHADAVKKQAAWKAYKKRQAVIKSVSQNAVKAANAAIAKERPADMPVVPKHGSGSGHMKPKKPKHHASGHFSSGRPKDLHCNNAKHFPKKYAKAGGGPQDCSGWAKANYCHKAKFASFMHTFCAKSCGCVNTEVLPTAKKVEMEFSEFLMPPPDML